MSAERAPRPPLRKTQATGYQQNDPRADSRYAFLTSPPVQVVRLSRDIAADMRREVFESHLGKKGQRFLAAVLEHTDYASRVCFRRRGYLLKDAGLEERWATMLITQCEGAGILSRLRYDAKHPDLHPPFPNELRGTEEWELGCWLLRWEVTSGTDLRDRLRDGVPTRAGRTVKWRRKCAGSPTSTGAGVRCQNVQGVDPGIDPVGDPGIDPVGDPGIDPVGDPGIDPSFVSRSLDPLSGSEPSLKPPTQAPSDPRGDSGPEERPSLKSGEPEVAPTAPSLVPAGLGAHPPCVQSAVSATPTRPPSEPENSPQTREAVKDGECKVRTAVGGPAPSSPPESGTAAEAPEPPSREELDEVEPAVRAALATGRQKYPGPLREHLLELRRAGWVAGDLLAFVAGVHRGQGDQDEDPFTTAREKTAPFHWAAKSGSVDVFVAAGHKMLGRDPPPPEVQERLAEIRSPASSPPRVADAHPDLVRRWDLYGRTGEEKWLNESTPLPEVEP